MLPAAIGIPVYNEEKFLQRTIESALKQNVAEIIISDNASTDASWDIITAMAHKDSRIKALRYESNKGQYANWMQCITSVTQPYFMFLGGHDILSPNHVASLLSTIQATQTIGSYAKPVHISPCLAALAADASPLIERLITFPWVKRLAHRLGLLRTGVYPYAKALRSSSPLFRLAQLYKNLRDGTPYYGLYLHKEFLEVYTRKDMLVADLFLIGHLALRGPIAFCPKAVYYKMDTLKHESLEERTLRYQKIARDFSAYQATLQPRELETLALWNLFKELMERYPEADMQMGQDKALK